VNAPFVVALLGLGISILFAVNAVRTLKAGKDGHSRNAAVIHIAMAGILAPLCLIVIATHLP
jgi:hypothetical protein